MGKLDLLERVEVTSRAEWRAWLKRHHTRTDGIWLVTYKKHVAARYVATADLVEETLCFGWIDSTARRLDENRRMIYVCPRGPKSVWSKVNKARIERLIASGRMTPAGLKKVEAAKRNGSWTQLDAVEAMEMPRDLEAALNRSKAARKHFDAFPPGARKQIIRWVYGAKTEPTRKRRVKQSVEMAARGIRANQPATTGRTSSSSPA